MNKNRMCTLKKEDKRVYECLQENETKRKQCVCSYSVLCYKPHGVVVCSSSHKQCLHTWTSLPTLVEWKKPPENLTLHNGDQPREQNLALMPTVKLTTPTNSTSDHIGPVTTYTAPGCCYKEPAVCALVEDGYRPFAAECTLTFGFAVDTMPFYLLFLKSLCGKMLIRKEWHEFPLNWNLTSTYVLL